VWYQTFKYFKGQIVLYCHKPFTGFKLHWPVTVRKAFSYNLRRARADWVRTWVRTVFFISSCSLFLLSSVPPASEPPCIAKFY
jgi:hypothetical protein